MTRIHGYEGEKKNQPHAKSIVKCIVSLALSIVKCTVSLALSIVKCICSKLGIERLKFPIEQW